MTMTLSRMTFALFAFAASATFAATLTGSGKPVTETRTVTGFTGIGLAVPGHLELTQGDRESLVITADDNVLPQIETVVEKGTLRIRFREKNQDVRRADIRITVTARMVENLAISGAGNIRSGPIRSKGLSLSIGGSGDLRIASLSVDGLSASIGGSGSITIDDGNADALSSSVAGSGDFSAAKLATKRASVNITGSGNTLLWVSEALSVSVVGSGGVRYYGDARVSRSIMGSGDVKRLGASPS